MTGAEMDQAIAAIYATPTAAVAKAARYMAGH
jgi:hypothetical protein